MDKFPSDNSSGELFEELSKREKNHLLLDPVPLSGLLLSLWNDSVVRQLSDQIASLINGENVSEVYQSQINLLNDRSDSVGQEPSFAMTNLFDPTSYLFKSDRANRHSDLDTANRDLDSLPANVAPDTAANAGKVSVNDTGDDEAPRISKAETESAALNSATLQDSARIEATLAGLRQRLQQQTEHLASVKQEIVRQAQSYQAKLDSLDQRYSTELQRIELKLSAYLDALPASAQGPSLADPAAQTAVPNSAYSTTYQVPSRPDSQWVSKPLGGIPIFLLLVVVGIVLVLLIAVAITPYGGSSGLLTATSHVTRLLLPAMAVVILLSGAIALIWELRR
ncbi:MAG: hypothetical protein ACR2FS_09430 [Phormidesmis sp.]